MMTTSSDRGGGSREPIEEASLGRPGEAALATVLTGEPVTHGALAVIPLLAPNLDDPDWLTLEEAGDRARVTEVSEAGSVPFLKVANGADRPLLLLDGEELIGAKQNRILNTTVRWRPTRR